VSEGFHFHMYTLQSKEHEATTSSACAYVIQLMVSV
jgi:hypothetical protein